MGIKFKLNKTAEDIANEVLGGGEALLYAAETAKKIMEPFVPIESGNLREDADVYREGEKAVVHYKAPYAGKNFYRVGRSTKSRSPFATAGWDLAAMKTGKGELVREVKGFLKRRGQQ